MITGDIRSNADQLADYLVKLKDNSHIEILEVDGRDFASKEYLKQTIKSMALNAELTKTDKAFLHVQLSPAYGEDKKMSPDDWHRAADILAKETGYEGQRRVIVLHTKKDRTHAHVVYERCNHATGKMIDNKHSRLKMDNARPLIEKALGHKATPRRNPQRPEIKIAVTKLWNEAKTGADFIKTARKSGYIIAEGTGKRPFMIVDENGRAFDLVRQIDGVRTKDVRERLRNEKLLTDKQAIELIHEKAGKNSGKQDQQKNEHKPPPSPEAFKKASAFAANRVDALSEDPAMAAKRQNEEKFAAFKADSKKATKQPEPSPSQSQTAKENAAKDFAENKADSIDNKASREEKKRKLIDEQKRKQQIMQQHKRKR